MYQKILVPVDGSETSDLGLHEAIRLAQNQNATLRLVHVVNEAIILSSYEGDLYTNTLIHMLRSGGETILHKAQSQAVTNNVAAETALLEAHGGRAGDLIIRETKAWHADLIVLGTHGRRGISRLILGSDAEHVVRLAPVPVLLVRMPGAHEAIVS